MTTDASQGGAAWRSIDSAPKDGAAVLLHAGRGVQMVARWKVGWSCWSSIPGDYTQHPTHWMPLPEPPEKEPS